VDEGFERFERILADWSRRDFLRRTGGAAALAALLVGVPGLLEACGSNSNGSPSSSGQPVKGGHLVEGNSTDFNSFNTAIAPGNTYGIVVSGLVFDGLLVDKPNGELQPVLAAALPAVSADGLTYTFKLRQDARWTDGRPVTAEDVVFTYQLFYDPAYKAVPSPRRGDMERYVESAIAVDQYTVAIKTKQQYAPFLVTHGKYGIMPKHVLGGLSPKEIATGPFNDNPTVTNGQFKVVKWDKGSQVVLERNTNYYRGAPLIDTFVRKVVPDTVVLAEQLKTGEVDFGPVFPAQLDAVKASNNVHIMPFDSSQTVFCGYNLDSSKSRYFQEKAVRQALAYAMDRSQMIKSVYFDEAKLVNSVVPAYTFAYDPGVKPKYGHDKAKAEQLLDSAGWKKNAQGIREKNGVQLSFHLDTSDGFKEWVSLAQIIQQEWKDIGVLCDIRISGVTTLIKNVEFDRQFDVALLSATLGEDPDVSSFFAGRNTALGGLNLSHYMSAEVDQLLDQAVSTVDRSKRKEIYAKIQDAIAEDVPMLFMLAANGIWGVNKRVRGFVAGTFAGTYRPWMNQVWVADGK